MTAFLKTIGGRFSDLRLDFDLFLGRLFRKKPDLAAPKPIGKTIPPEKTLPVERLPFSLRILSLNFRARWFFYDQMATLVGSGVTLIDSLSLLRAQSKRKDFRILYGELIRHVNGGLALSEAMALFPRAFPPMQAALVGAGEKSGNLKTVLARIADDLESQDEFTRKLKGAMFYPIVVMILALAMVSGMVVFVIPKISKLYEESHAELPALTQTVIDISHFIALNYALILAFGAILSFLFWILISKTRLGRWGYETFVDSLPVLGRIVREKNLLMFASNLGMLLDSGVLISTAFDITEKTVDSLHYRKAIAEIRHGLVMGKSVSEMMGLKDIRAQQFEEHPLFPLAVAQMIHIGEVTGTLSKMLIKIRQNYHRSVEYTLKNFSTLVEPLMIFLVALLVGSILLAVMLPFFYIGTTIH